MAKLIAVLLAILAATLPAVAQAPPSDAQEGTILRFNKKYSDLPAEYRKPIELAFVFDRWLNSDYETTIDDPFSIALIDLNDDGTQEVVIRFNHVYHGMVQKFTILIARKTAAGWRFIGEVEAPQFSQHELIPPQLADLAQIYVEDRTVNGWRVLNNGPAWAYWHLSREYDIMGGRRYCWAKTAPPPDYQYDAFNRRGLPFDKGDPGYFNNIYATDFCPKN